MHGCLNVYLCKPVLTNFVYVNTLWNLLIRKVEVVSQSISWLLTQGKIKPVKVNKDGKLAR